MVFLPQVAFGAGFVASGSIQNTTQPVVSEKKWIQKAFQSIKARGTKGVCTGKKFGSKSCPAGSKRYNMAKNLRKLGKKK